VFTDVAVSHARPVGTDDAVAGLCERGDLWVPLILGDEVTVQEYDGFPGAFVGVAVAAPTDSMGFDLIGLHLFSYSQRKVFADTTIRKRSQRRRMYVGIQENGNWWIDIYLQGQRVRRKVGPDKRTAQLVEKDLKVKAARGEWPDIRTAKPITFRAFCAEFQTRLAGKAASTVKNYEVACRVHFVPFLGDLHLSEIRPKHIDDFKQLRANAAKHSTVNLELVLLGSILNAAVTRGYLKENPAKSIPPIRIPEKEPRYLTRDQVAKLYPECTDWIYTFVAIGLNTGLRNGEVCALTWQDVDLKNRTLKVRSDEDFTTKGKGDRAVPLNGFLYNVLKKAPRHIKNSHILFTREGKSLVRKRFTKAAKRAGLPHFTPHDLRSTFGTWLAADGVDVVTIKNLMGHTDVKTTMKYLHAAPNRMEWAVENLNLDGQTQAEVDQSSDQKMDRTGPDLVTSGQGRKTASA
jgi:integrase